MKSRLPLWVSLLQSSAATLAPPDAAEQAEQDDTAARCESYVVYVAGHRMRVVYDPPPAPRKEGPR
jgi:hypothetical protein